MVPDFDLPNDKRKRTNAAMKGGSKNKKPFTYLKELAKRNEKYLFSPR
jgi:hypothetical protein